MRSLAIIGLLVALCLLAAGCGHPGAKSDKNFDQIRDLVKGKTASEVEQLLGKPDSQQDMLTSAKRWVWWNYTYLDGKNYPPEMRGKVVHLEIIFERSGEAVEVAGTPSEWRAIDPLGVSYTIPSGGL